MVPAYRVPAAAFVIMAVSIAAFASVMWQTDRSIGKSYAAAFEQDQATSTVGTRSDTFDRNYLHLGKLPADDVTRPTKAAFQPGIGIGDEISFTSRTGTQQKYQIVSLQPLSLKDGETGIKANVYLVTAVVTDGSSDRTFRFIVDADSFSASTPAVITPHAL